jgi:hypothetical protein
VESLLCSKGTVHTDIEPQIILIERKEQGGEITVEQVQVVDIRDAAAYVLGDCVVKGRQVGNWMWRSPDAHASAQLHTLSDMFSFGLLVSLGSLCDSPQSELL